MKATGRLVESLTITALCVLSLGPGRAAEAQLYIGDCDFMEGRDDQALKAFDRVLVHFSTSTVVPTAYLKKAQVLERMKKPKEALAVYDTIVRKYPYRKETLAARARLDALRERKAEPPE